MKLYDMMEIDNFIKERADEKAYQEFSIWTMSIFTEYQKAGGNIDTLLIMLTDELPIMTVQGDDAEVCEGNWAFSIMKPDPKTGMAIETLGVLILFRSKPGELPEKVIRVMVANTEKLH